MQDIHTAPELVEFRAEITATRPVIEALGPAPVVRQTNVLANMVVTTECAPEKVARYVELLRECRGSGNYGPLFELYCSVNVPELERRAAEDVDIVGQDVQNASRNMLAYIAGTDRAYRKRGTLEAHSVGVPPLFQIPYWLLDVRVWLKEHPGTTMGDVYRALENTPDPPPARRVGAG